MNYVEDSDLKMIEVGSYAGAGADIFCNTGKVASLWCIDPWLPGYDETDEASYTDFTKVEAEFDKVAEKHSSIIHKFKGTLEQFINQNPDVHPDLIYIDGNHTYDGCKTDILNSLKLKPKWISGHDYAGWGLGVVKAVNEVFTKPDNTFSDSSWIVDLRKRT